MGRASPPLLPRNDLLSVWLFHFTIQYNTIQMEFLYSAYEELHICALHQLILKCFAKIICFKSRFEFRQRLRILYSYYTFYRKVFPFPIWGIFRKEIDSCKLKFYCSQTSFIKFCNFYNEKTFHFSTIVNNRWYSFSNAQ